MAIAEAPLFRHAWRKLGELLTSGKHVATAEILVEQMLPQTELLRQERLQLQGMLSIIAQDYELAWQLLEQSASAATDDDQQENGSHCHDACLTMAGRRMPNGHC